MPFTNGTSTTSLSALMKTYYDRLFLKMAEPVMVAHQFADKSRDIPTHEGQTVSFQRYIPLAVITATTAEGVNPTMVELSAVNVDATLEKLASGSVLSEEVQLMAIDKTLKAAVELHGQNMGESINRRYRKEMALGFYPMRVDNHATYAQSGTVASASDLTTTTARTSLTLTDHQFADGLIVFTSGRCAGQSGLVTAVADSNNVVTWSPAFKQAPENGDAFRIVRTDGIAATNVVTCAAAERAVAILRHYKAPKYDGKYYIGIMSPFVAYDFMQDSGWVNADHYSKDEKVYTGEVGRWGGIRWVMDTEPWTEIVTDGSAHEATQDRGFGLYSATGVVNHTPVFGRHSYAGIRLEGAPDKVMVKVPGPNSTDNPINARSTVGWRVYFVPKALNSVWGVNILSGASTVA